MKKLVVLLLLLPGAAFAGDPWYASVSYTSAAVRVQLRGGKTYLMQCGSSAQVAQPVRYKTGGSTVTVSSTSGANLGVYVADSLTNLVEITLKGADQYVSVIPVPAATGTCEFFEKE